MFIQTREEEENEEEILEEKTSMKPGRKIAKEGIEEVANMDKMMGMQTILTNTLYYTPPHIYSLLQALKGKHELRVTTT